MSLSTAFMGVGGLVIAYGGYEYLHANNQREKWRALNLVIFGIATIAIGNTFFTEDRNLDELYPLLGGSRVFPSKSNYWESQNCILGDVPNYKMPCIEGVDILSTRIPVGSTMSKLIQHLRESMDFTSCRDFLHWKISFYAPGTRSIENIPLSVMRSPKMWGFDPFGRFYFAQKVFSERFGHEVVAVHQSCPLDFEDFVAFKEPAELDFS